MQPLSFLQMNIQITEEEREKILDLLIDMRHSSQCSSSIEDTFRSLVLFAQSQGYKVFEAPNLASEEKAWGMIIPKLGMIFYQPRELPKVVSTLSHEIGHLIADRANVNGRKDFEEALADKLGDVILEFLFIH